MGCIVEVLTKAGHENFSGLSNWFFALTGSFLLSSPFTVWQIFGLFVLRAIKNRTILYITLCLWQVFISAFVYIFFPRGVGVSESLLPVIIMALGLVSVSVFWVGLIRKSLNKNENLPS